MRALTNINNKENILVLPQKLPDFDNKQYVFSKMDFYNKKLGAYLRWIKEIKKIIKKEQPDVVHFLYGDVFYKYFGLGLEGLKRKYKVINTVHALKKGKNRNVEFEKNLSLIIHGRRSIQMLSIMLLRKVELQTFHMWNIHSFLSGTI